jgi:hypothetical protein
MRGSIMLALACGLALACERPANPAEACKPCEPAESAKPADPPTNPSPPPDRRPPPGSRMHGVFEAKVPCADCQLVKVRLTLHRDIADGLPTTYVLERIYVGKGNDRHTTRGQWSEATGARVDPEGFIVALDDATPDEFRRFLAVGDDLLLMLDAELEPRVGDNVHSFTLSRTDD